MAREGGAPITVRGLGHVSFFVRDLDATRRFYRDVLGLRETGTGKNGRIVFFSIHGGTIDAPDARTKGAHAPLVLSRPRARSAPAVPGRSSTTRFVHELSAGRHHHDVSCEVMRAEGSGPPPHGVPGLSHVAFDVGTSLDDLAAARGWVESHRLEPFGETPTSFCVRDPDGHMIELYVERDGS